MPSLRTVLARSLGAAFEGRAPRVEAWMRQHSLGLAALETSVRGGADATMAGPMTAGRMMIERVAPDAVPGFFAALDAAFPERAAVLTRAAMELELPMIVGWDASRARVGKLYANASDASRGLRARLARALDHEVDAAPHVVGLNLDSARVEEKSYVQSAEAPRAYAKHLGVFDGLAQRGVVGGWVVSQTHAPSGLRPRALFAALRAGHPDARGALSSLPGWDEADVTRKAAFGVGTVSSVGLDLTAPPAWTVYFKPGEVDATSWASEPAVVVRREGVELGLFVEPAALGRRAWAVVDERALSYRVREGDVEAGTLDALRAWACARLAAGAELAAGAGGAPLPERWHVVDLP